jgi:hypothetical protein
VSFLAGVEGPHVGWYPYHDNNMHPLLDAFQELVYQQIDFNGRNQTDVMHVQFFQKDGVR